MSSSTPAAAAASSALSASALSSSQVASVSEYPLKGQQFTLRWGLSAAVLGLRVYIFGGYLWSQGIEGFFQDFYELDLTTGSVRRATVEGPVPCARFGHSLAADPLNGVLVLFGGRNSTESFADCWGFDPLKGAWTLLSGPLYRRGVSGKKKSISNTSQPSSEDSVGGPEARSWQSLSVWNGCAFVYGGWDHANRVFNDLWMFDIMSQRWTRIDSPTADGTVGSPPHGRSCHQAVVWNDWLYVFGGLRDGDAVTSDIWRYSLENRIWQPVETRGLRPGGRVSAASTLCGSDTWLIHGGLVGYPRPGSSAQESILEFNFLTQTWTSRTLVVSESAKNGAQRYGHAAIALPNSFSVLLLGGAEKYAAACTSLACRVDLLPSQSHVAAVTADLLATSRLAQLNRDRLSDVVEVVQNYEGQLRTLKAENGHLTEKIQGLHEQLTALHQQYTTLQAAMTNMQQTLAAVEQVIPMMRSVGAAIAAFGNTSWPGTSTPNSSASLSGPTRSSTFGGTGLSSVGDLRFKETSA